MYTLVGLGNPGEEYEHTRHNAGRMALIAFAKKMNVDEWEFDKKRQSLKTELKIKRDTHLLLLPETFMNKSGKAVTSMSQKKAKMLVVAHDDIDLPLGRFKISFGKGSGGHKGIDSIKRALKTKEFIRLRIGISPRKKPPQKDVPDFLLKKFSKKELDALKKVFKKTNEALETIITEGRQKAMNLYN